MRGTAAAKTVNDDKALLWQPSTALAEDYPLRLGDNHLSSAVDIWRPWAGCVGRVFKQVDLQFFLLHSQESDGEKAKECGFGHLLKPAPGSQRIHGTNWVFVTVNLKQPVEHCEHVLMHSMKCSFQSRASVLQSRSLRVAVLLSVSLAGPEWPWTWSTFSSSSVLLRLCVSSFQPEYSPEERPSVEGTGPGGPHSGMCVSVCVCVLKTGARSRFFLHVSALICCAKMLMSDIPTQ